MKSFLKEIGIILLLCLAIVLIFAVLFYEYVPSNKTLPEEVSYTTPEAVSKELVSASNVDESKIVKTYSVDSSDMASYQSTKSYNPGNSNPFASIPLKDAKEDEEAKSAAAAAANATSTSTGTNSSTSTTSQSGSTNSSSSTGTTINNSNPSGTGYVQNTTTK